ncbi:MAG: type II toxin-antitoxin system HicB family antitoxin [Candidatus Sulfotelmatobacter sp.]
MKLLYETFEKLNSLNLRMITVEKTAVSRISTENIEQCFSAERNAVKYLVIYEQSESGWSAYSPDLPGLGAGAKTLEETKKLIRETMELHLEGMRRQGSPLPEPSEAIEIMKVNAHA